MISMERDWVPVLAVDPIPAPTGSFRYTLSHLNAVMRRIDLICKLLAPVVISLVISFTSISIGVMVVAIMSCVSWGFEILSARQVWQSNTRLQERRPVRGTCEPSGAEITQSPLPNIGKWTVRASTRQIYQLRAYFKSDVWIPSIALALLHVSVLSYSATFVTYLLNSGFSLILITVVRATSSIVEVSSTFVAPRSIEYLARSKRGLNGYGDTEQLLSDSEGVAQKDRHAVGLARSGLWGISLQLGCLVSLLSSIPYAFRRAKFSYHRYLWFWQS